MDFPDRVILLDGSMGRELRARGVEILHTIWSANALIVAPDEVVNVHRDYIVAGADIITTNTYSVIRRDLALEGIENRFEELNITACELAMQARESTGRDVHIAGSLPPLRGSYRPDLVGPDEEISALYREQAGILAAYVDLILCETMSSAREARAAATAGCETGLPVWVSFTLNDKADGRLRSGESIAEAYNVLKDLPVSGILLNCSSPEAISAGVPVLSALPLKYLGAYANRFIPVPDDVPRGDRALEDDAVEERPDLTPAGYGHYAAAWLSRGVNVIGGCCGMGPQYIAALRQLIIRGSS